MINASALLSDLQGLCAQLVEDLRARSEDAEAVGSTLADQYREARAAGRTDRSHTDWEEDLFQQVAVGWVLASVFVRFCEDNGLFDPPLLSGAGDRRRLAGDHRAAWLAEHPAAGDREWLEEVFGRYRALPATAELFGEHNPLWQVGPSADGAKLILELWQRIDHESGALTHDFTDPSLDTRFLGDLYQDLSEQAKKTYALLQTPAFVERFILDRTLDPAIETFGLDGFRMIDPTCGSGHFLLGAFERLLERWRSREPGTPQRELVQRALDAVHGVDLNPFAAAIARFRLLVEAMRASGIGALRDAPGFRIHVAVGDSLLHGTRSGELFAGTEGMSPLLRHRYPTEDEEEANRILTAGRYHAVVGNPPYITVKEPALRAAYRSMYETASGTYSLGVPFTERFLDLAVTVEEGGSAGYVGMITTNTFMKRSFGRKLVQNYLPRVDLTHIVDTSGAYIPGHGTPTVILFMRHQAPASDVVRTVLGIRGEPGRPDDAARGEVWTSIERLMNRPGSENEFVSVEDAPRERYATHPWSLQGGAAPDVLTALTDAGMNVLGELCTSIGFASFPGLDGAFVARPGSLQRAAVPHAMIRPFVRGEYLRDWVCDPQEEGLIPLDRQHQPLPLDPDSGWFRWLWPFRRMLSGVKSFGGKTRTELGEPWWTWYRWVGHKYDVTLSITFAEVATHNHFVLDRGAKVFKQTAPVVKLPESTSGDDHLALLGLLNSSTACFWLKQKCHCKGSTVDARGARQTAVPFEDFYQFDGTKLKQFPLPRGAPLARARELDALASELTRTLPSVLLAREPPTRPSLDAARHQAEQIRARMVALQEDLDWECYALYGLTEEDVSLAPHEVPRLKKGDRAFEIVLARRIASGDVESTWFERHGSEPRTDLPAEWPAAYRNAVERRIALIEADRAIGLLERPEYKRRWNWDGWNDMETAALRDWLLDRMEARELWERPELSTTERLADRLRRDDAFVEAARLFAGRSDADLSEVVAELVQSEAVPFAAAHRYKPSGMRKRRDWERVWALQRAEDAIAERRGLPADHPQHLSDAEAGLLKRDQGLDDIPVPPKYGTKDFRRTEIWRVRGKLDVPNERFISYPGTRVGADSSVVIGWAGWDHLMRARALASHYHARKDAGGDADELLGLLAGLHELVPWLLQWHNEVDPDYGQRMGDFFETFVETEARGHGVTPADLARWTPGR